MLARPGRGFEGWHLSACFGVPRKSKILAYQCGKILTPCSFAFLCILLKDVLPPPPPFNYLCIYVFYLWNHHSTFYLCMFDFACGMSSDKSQRLTRLVRINFLLVGLGSGAIYTCTHYRLAEDMASFQHHKEVTRPLILRPFISPEVHTRLQMQLHE